MQHTENELQLKLRLIKLGQAKSALEAMEEGQTA